MKKSHKESKPTPPKEVVHHEEKKQEKGREVLKETKQEAEERQEQVISNLRLGKKSPEVTVAEKIAESRKALEQPLSPGQKFFETPEGEIIIGDSEVNQVWARNMNGGKGGWANPHR